MDPYQKVLGNLAWCISALAISSKCLCFLCHLIHSVGVCKDIISNALYLYPLRISGTGCL